MKLLSSLVVAATVMMTSTVFADGHITWKSVAEESRVAFGSIKRNVAGEVHHFNNVVGTVKENGDVSITIDLASIETNIDIRNERMIKHVFQEGKAAAVITGKINMDEINGLKPGQTDVIEIEAKFTFAGIENDIDAEMLVARLSEDRVLVSTADFIMLSTEDLGIDPGVDILKKLADLSGITRVTPVAIRMVFAK